MKSLSVFVLLTLALAIGRASGATPTLPIPGFRPPAIPLIMNDPYMNIWAFADNLTDVWSSLWDGTTKAFVGMIRIDGTPYRFLGPEYQAGGTLPPALVQQNVTVYPTRTVVYYEPTDGIQLRITFTSPLLPNSLPDEVWSRPITYLTYDVWSTDGQSHAIELYYDNTGEVCVNTIDTEVMWQVMPPMRTNAGQLLSMRMGVYNQTLLSLAGDGVGIQWGWVYAATMGKQDVSYTTNNALQTRNQFALNGTLPGINSNMPVAVEDNWPVLAYAWNLGEVSPDDGVVSRYVIIGYDDVMSIDWFGRMLPSYWRAAANLTAALEGDIYDPSLALALLVNASNDYTAVTEQCEQFDEQLLLALFKAGGAQYATMAALAYRQTLAGCKLVWNAAFPESTWQPPTWYFLKEISSDGDLSTVDVLFPASPLFLYVAPDLLQRMLGPLLAYANNESAIPYDYPWAPHHLGFYPIAFIYSSQQENMPIEETGNMLLMITAVAQAYSAVDKADNPLSGWIYPHYWPLMQQWAQYLAANLPDPGSQLCTDDFEGPTPHDANLAAKGIVALAAYATLCDMLGQVEEAEYYLELASVYADKWLVLANDTKWFRLEYNVSGSWSLKYNIFYQLVLGLNTFSDYVINTELNYYMTQMAPYGVPLDDRAAFTKLDWLNWVAAMANEPSQFNAIITATYNYANQTPSRIPLSDWYNTPNAAAIGFQARPVVGALFAKALLTYGYQSAPTAN